MTTHEREPTNEIEEAMDAGTITPASSLASRGMLPAQEKKYGTLADRLFQKYGPGDNSRLRELLFSRIEREACMYGEPVYRIVVGAVRSSSTANNPGRYFCATVSRRLKEAGFLQDAESDF